MKRNSNFELMRMVSMFLIVIWHIIMHGHVIENCTNPAIKILLEIVMFSIIIHVNSFVLLSGYFQSKSKFKLSKFLKIFLQVVFYSLIILVTSIKLGWVKDYGIVTFINNGLLSSLNNYWFIKMYLVTYVFSDYINKFIDRLSRNEYKNLLVICFVVLSIIPYITGNRVVFNDGYSFTNFIFIYMIGGYLRRYPLKETYHFKNMSTNGYRLLLLFSFFSLVFINFLVHHFALEINGMSGIFTEVASRISPTNLHYSTPLVIIQTILYFEFFKTLNIENKFINKLSATAFGIYLMHDNEFVRAHLYKFLRIDMGPFSTYKIFPKIILVALIIFIICALIEFIRQLISKKVCSFKFSVTLKEKIKNYINSFNFNINW